MGASVRIEDEAFSDTRYERLAAETNLVDADHARGKMLRIWRQCTIEQRQDLEEIEITLVLGEHGVDALISSRLARRLTSGRVHICGTKGRIEWLGRLRKNGKYGKLGGRPKKPTRVTKNDKSKTPPAPAPAPAPALDRESGSAPDLIDLQKLSEIGFSRFGMLGGSMVPRLGRLTPVAKWEWDAVLATRGDSWAYACKVLENIREESAKGKASPAGDAPKTKEERDLEEFLRRTADQPGVAR